MAENGSEKKSRTKTARNKTTAAELLKQIEKSKEEVSKISQSSSLTRAHSILRIDPEILKRYQNVFLNHANLPNIHRTLNTPMRDNLENRIVELKQEIDKKQQELAHAQSAAGNQEAKLKEILAKYTELQEKQSLSHILNRVGEAGGNRIYADSAFRAQFQSDKPCKAYVLAIDIRRSTELMLKAREPRLFADFITELAVTLREIVLENFGVFDKFTGDGILAVFPEFFSGEDAGYHAVNTAMLCHQAFDKIYREHRNCFMAVLRDTGLGVGIDYGDVQMVEIGGEFTVVGTPVVYACRMSGAPAHQTLVNQPGYEQLFDKYVMFDFSESEIEVKHEGLMVAYKVNINGKRCAPKQPSWLSEDASALKTNSGGVSKA